MTTKDVPERLRVAADIYEQRNELYGDNYEWIGIILAATFKHDPVLSHLTVDGWNRLVLFIQCTGKMTRYGQQWGKGGHEDSLDDLSVYAQMLAKIDDKIRERRSDTAAATETKTHQKARNGRRKK